MNILKNNLRLIIFVVILILISSGIGVFATYNYLATDVKYTDDKSVADALNELYGKEKNVECIWNSTDNLVNPKSSISKETTILHNGIFIVDISAVEGNNTLSSKWSYYLKINNVQVDTTDGFCNGWNGHYHYIVKVKSGDIVTLYSGVNFTTNYNAVSLGGYLIY